jgi:hypothetical protein
VLESSSQWHILFDVLQILVPVQKSNIPRDEKPQNILVLFPIKSNQHMHGFSHSTSAGRFRSGEIMIS